VNKIAAGFDPDKFGELSVEEKEVRGKRVYYIFNGQHRWHAAKKVLGTDTQKVPCAVHDEAPEEQLARTFTGLNATLPVSQVDNWPIRVIAREETAVEVSKLLAKHQLKVGKFKTAGTIIAISAVEGVYKKYGSEVLDKVLRVIISAWEREPDSFEGSFIRALGILCSRFNGDINYDELAKKLGKTAGPSRLLGQARDYAKVNGLSLERALANRIAGVYNKKKTTNRIEI
jgi:hypothetical protein